MITASPRAATRRSAACRKQAQERARMVAGLVAELRADIAAHDTPAAQENALRARAQALDAVATETCGPAFTASLFGCHGRSYEPGAKRIVDQELARVFKRKGQSA